MEIWKDIIGYEGRYTISNYGRVETLNYKRTGQSRIMAIGWSGLYAGVALYRGGKRDFNRYRIHRLVAEHFLDTWDRNLEVNHIDGNKLNNHISNLEMASPRENMAHARASGLVNNKGHLNNRAKHTKEEVDMIRWYYHCKKLKQQEIADLFNSTQPQINFILRYKRYP